MFSRSKIVPKIESGYITSNDNSHFYSTVMYEYARWGYLRGEKCNGCINCIPAGICAFFAWIEEVSINPLAEILARIGNG